MLTYRKVFLTILLCSLLIIALGWVAALLNAWLVLILITLNFGVLIAGSFIVCSGLYLKIHCSGNTTEKKIHLSFDDGPDPTITPGVLDLLGEYDIKASFFLIGKNIKGNEAIIKRMLDEGHIIGNHSHSHSNFFGFFSSSKVTDELEKTDLIIEKVCGRKPGYFRPPFGVTNPNIAKAARTLGHEVVGWNIRSLDGVKNNSEKTIHRVHKKLRPGGIILFHDTHKGIVEILEKVIENARKDGYEFVPLNEFININNTE